MIQKEAMVEQEWKDYKNEQNSILQEHKQKLTHLVKTVGHMHEKLTTVMLIEGLYRVLELAF